MQDAASRASISLALWNGNAGGRQPKVCTQSKQKRHRQCDRGFKKQRSGVRRGIGLRGRMRSLRIGQEPASKFNFETAHPSLFQERCAWLETAYASRSSI